jgi:hypothetical protein
VTYLAVTHLAVTQVTDARAAYPLRSRQSGGNARSPGGGRGRDLPTRPRGPGRSSSDHTAMERDNEKDCSQRPNIRNGAAAVRVAGADAERGGSFNRFWCSRPDRTRISEREWGNSPGARGRETCRALAAQGHDTTHQTHLPAQSGLQKMPAQQIPAAAPSLADRLRPAAQRIEGRFRKSPLRVSGRERTLA